MSGSLPTSLEPYTEKLHGPYTALNILDQEQQLSPRRASTSWEQRVLSNSVRRQGMGKRTDMTPKSSPKM